MIETINDLYKICNIIMDKENKNLIIEFNYSDKIKYIFETNNPVWYKETKLKTKIKKDLINDINRTNLNSLNYFKIDDYLKVHDTYNEEDKKILLNFFHFFEQSYGANFFNLESYNLTNNFNRYKNLFAFILEGFNFKKEIGINSFKTMPDKFEKDDLEYLKYYFNKQISFSYNNTDYINIENLLFDKNTDLFENYHSLNKITDENKIKIDYLRNYIDSNFEQDFDYLNMDKIELYKKIVNYYFINLLIDFYIFEGFSYVFETNLKASRRRKKYDYEPYNKIFNLDNNHIVNLKKILNLLDYTGMNEIELINYLSDLFIKEGNYEYKDLFNIESYFPSFNINKQKLDRLSYYYIKHKIVIIESFLINVNLYLSYKISLNEYPQSLKYIESNLSIYENKFNIELNNNNFKGLDKFYNNSVFNISNEFNLGEYSIVYEYPELDINNYYNAYRHINKDFDIDNIKEKYLFNLRCFPIMTILKNGKYNGFVILNTFNQIVGFFDLYKDDLFETLKFLDKFISEKVLNHKKFLKMYNTNDKYLKDLSSENKNSYDQFIIDEKYYYVNKYSGYYYDNNVVDIGNVLIER